MESDNLLKNKEKDKESVAMLKIGCHLSTSKGFVHMGKEAESIGANCFQFFTRNPRGGKAKNWAEADVSTFLEFAGEHHIGNLLAHAPYTLNPCAKDSGLREFAYETMREDLTKLQVFPECRYNFHPGSHVEQGVEEGMAYIIEMLDRLQPSDFSTTVLLETMAGKGTEIGRSFEELKLILDGVRDNRNIGVCLDTCHVFDGGYDIVSDLDGVLAEFDRVIGLERLKAIHLNDSQNTLGSHKDRHEKIGQGQIGLEAFERIINHPKLQNIPFYLETPNEVEGYAQEIALLRRLYKGI